MKFRNVREKIQFIDKLHEDNSMSVRKKIPTIVQLSKDKNTEVRINLASNLVLFDCIEIEEILSNMLSDKNRMVRLEALDSLVIGRQKKTIEKIRIMLMGEGQFIRAYAVHAIFDVVVNCYGFNKIACSIYKNAIKDSYANEKDLRVLIEYYRNQYYIDNDKGIQLLEKSYKEAINESRYNLIWSLLHIFQEIQNKKNKSFVAQIIMHRTELILPAQKMLVDEIISKTVINKILIIDMDNIYLSHVVSLLLCSRKIIDVDINTAGLKVGTVMEEEIKNFCRRHKIIESNDLYSKKITEIYMYDYIICINVYLDKMEKSKVIHFENIDASNDEQIMKVCKKIEYEIHDSII